MQVIKELEITPEQFIDVCILCGCDYCPKIGGIGPTRALALIKKHGSIEKVGGQEAGRLGKWAGGRCLSKSRSSCPARATLLPLCPPLLQLLITSWSAVGPHVAAVPAVRISCLMLLLCLLCSLLRRRFLRWRAANTRSPSPSPTRRRAACSMVGWWVGKEGVGVGWAGGLGGQMGALPL